MKKIEHISFRRIGNEVLCIGSQVLCGGDTYTIVSISIENKDIYIEFKNHYKGFISGGRIYIYKNLPKKFRFDRV